MWLLRCLAPLLLLALGCIPAAAQCDLYVAEYKSTTVDVYNTFTDQLVAAIPVQLQPLAVAITPNGAFAYVSNSAKICDLCGAIQSPSVSVIDTATYNFVATIPEGNYPYGVAIPPNRGFAYVTNSASNNVSIINTATNTVVAAVAVGCGPEAVAITPNGAFAYVANSCDSTISVIDTATSTVTTTFNAGGSEPMDLAITPDGAFAYVSNQISGNLSVIDTASNTVVDSIQGAPMLSEGVAITRRRDALTSRCR